MSGYDAFIGMYNRSILPSKYPMGEDLFTIKASEPDCRLGKQFQQRHEVRRWRIGLWMG
jgi:hypothetical protein